MTTSIIIILVTIAIAVFAIIRNNWTFNRQIKLISNPLQYEYLSYLQMFARFWIWDVEKLKRKKI